jgi:hypothetical protein
MPTTKRAGSRSCYDGLRGSPLLGASVNKPFVAESMSASAGTEEDLGTLGYCLRRSLRSGVRYGTARPST